MNLTFRQLKVFDVVARHLNYTSAAKELHLSQPAVSMQVKQLEEQVDTPLIEKLGKKLYLTDIGIEMHNYARSTMQQLIDLEETIGQLKTLQQGHLKLAVASTANHFVIRLLAHFAKSHPKIRISLDVTNRSSLLAMLEKNECDLVIMGRPPDAYNLMASPFLENPLVVVTYPEHYLAAKKKVSLKELIKEEFVMREQGSGTRIAIERFFSNQEMEFKTKMDMSNNRAIKHAAEEGLGMAIVSMHTLELELKANTLKIVNVEGFPIFRHWYVVQREGKRLSPIATVFKDYIMKGADDVVHDFTAPLYAHLEQSAN
ncbi:MAG: LysR family transcriptional regulator [gamma proteobacterium symbiont of Bathyaustriella thionipta]|nr:LysR family transcriptional regulator [gamma proteobacterium symbiont of Bathyaustriella thionipta]MCU7949210.1 LysR family transcriptional regulator [gamma proteobacterium symbiont of Bathyaustriella thionipta]MCU7954902.1 LysR family transcriptional regulator [gamma proteobacterium symbiont of Bathyaustriella thionipta]MCU7955777.1 LysR family transcriptional regulator [gamma proteobacterium symbiont of Bathyaustriella thionipta]MCU7966012.1 LysR family transcriptional regulator [gamma pro